jgi:lipoyl(octanoyl) transferase
VYLTVLTEKIVQTCLKIPSEPLTVDWQTEKNPVAYDAAVTAMENRAQAIGAQGENGLVWLLEHPPLYTAGTSANAKDLINPAFPVYETGRGGQYTYHGPGQRIAYVMLDLHKRGSDLRKYICDLEEWMILSLKDLGVKGERRTGRIGIWVAANNSEAKIAAVGVRVRKWVTYHGVSINVNPDLSHYTGIVPCGISDYGVTSLQALGINAAMSDLDLALQHNWNRVFA